MELFYQVFDKGMMEDGEGREIDFKNTIIILTTNAGTGYHGKTERRPGNYASPEGLAESAQAGTKQNFQTCISRPSGDHPYLPIRDENMK